MSIPVLDIAGLSITFPGLARCSRVVRQVDLTVDAGSILGLVGESGSGKTMTGLACLGMVPAPGAASGSIRIDGSEVLGRPDNHIGQMRGGRVAMIFQNPMRSLNPFFTIGRQMIEIIGRHRSCGRRDARAIAIAELKSAQIPDCDLVLDRYPHELSGGQSQRVMIALALACRPRLLIADEPTTSLDVTVQAQIVSLLRRLTDTTGVAVLFITHDLGIVSQLCDRVAVMYGGRIVESGSVAHVIDNPQHPYSAKLIRTIPTLGRGRQELESIPGQVPNPARIPEGCVFQDRCDIASDTCRRLDPPMVSASRGHTVACHHPSCRRNAARQAS